MLSGCRMVAAGGLGCPAVAEDVISAQRMMSLVAVDVLTEVVIEQPVCGGRRICGFATPSPCTGLVCQHRVGGPGGRLHQYTSGREWTSWRGFSAGWLAYTYEICGPLFRGERLVMLHRPRVRSR